MASGMPVTDSADDFVYEGVKLQTAEDYKQHRKVQAIIDAQETVLDRRERAYEYLWEGRIGQEDYLKAIRMAVERYLLLSKQAIRESKYSQWFWEGEPLTHDGSSPFDHEGELIALAENEEVPLPNGDQTMTVRKILQTGRYQLNRPVLVGDNSGEPVFGREANILGVLPMADVDRQIVFQGLESFWEAEDPIIRESESVNEHPTRLFETRSEVHRYQIPEEVSMAAFDQINEFWWVSGMSVNLDRGQTIIEGFDMSHHEKYVHTKGSPPI